MTPVAGQLVEHFFRHESANLIAVLTRAFGIRRLELIEDVVQAAMLEAMNTWKHRGVPKNPAGWMHAVAKNRILDAMRKERVHERALALSGQTQAASDALVEEWLEPDQLPDSLLRMMFVCCHPALDRKSQIALTLKVLCGFGVREIARGLLLSPESVKKRIQRAKKRLAELRLKLDLPEAEHHGERLAGVHDVLYLMFNEGYSTSQGSDPIRDDLCEEAARLCHMLCTNDVGSETTRALLALMLFHAARLEARVDTDGAVLLLEDQDRSAWDRNLIRIAEQWLSRSGAKPSSRFHLEAAIALLHCKADSVAHTDWETIVHLYDRLIGMVDSPVYALNRAIARGQAGDSAAALAELETIAARPDMSEYYLVDCARARMHELQGHPAQAIARYEAALAHDVAGHERRLIELRLRRLSDA